MAARPDLYYKSVMLIAKLNEDITESVEKTMEIIGEDKFLFPTKRDNRNMLLLYTKFEVTDKQKYFSNTIPPEHLDIINEQLKTAFDRAVRYVAPRFDVYTNGVLRVMFEDVEDGQLPLHLYLNVEVLDVQAYITFFDRVYTELAGDDDDDDDGAYKRIMEVVPNVRPTTERNLGIVGEGWEIQIVSAPTTGVLLGMLKPLNEDETLNEALRRCCQLMATVKYNMEENVPCKDQMSLLSFKADIACALKQQG